MLKSMKRIIVYLLCSGMIAGSMSLFPTVAKADTPAVDVGNCTTASSTAAKVVTTTAYNSRDAQAGDRISVTFTKGLVTNKINTIAIGSTTAEKVAKPLVYDWQAQKWPANTSFTLVYDGTSYHFEKPTATAVNPEETPFIVFDLSNTGQSSSAGSASGYVNFPFMDLTKVKKLVVSGKMQSYDKSGTWQKGLSAQIRFFDANNTEITEMSAAYSNHVHLIPWRTVGDIYEINLDNIKNSYDLSSVYGYASESITNIDHWAAEGGYSGGSYWNNGIYVTLTVTETGPKSPSFGEKFGSNLTDVTAIEGSKDGWATTFSVNATFPNGENPEGTDGSYAWYYAPASNPTAWTRITDETQLVHGDGENRQVTTFKGHGNGTGTSAIPISQSSRVSIENPRCEDDGMQIKVVLLANDGNNGANDVESSVATLTIVKSNFTSLDSTLLNATQNIGTELDLMSSLQFANMVDYDNGTHKIFTNRAIRYLNDPDATTLADIEAKIAAGGYTAEQLGDPVTEGTLTSFIHEVTAGEHTLFIIVPDFEDTTKSVVDEVTYTGVDLMGPTMDPIDARWISQNGGIQVDGEGKVVGFALEDPYEQGGVKGANFPLHLSVSNIKDNVTDASDLTIKWLRNGTEITTYEDAFPYAGIEYVDGLPTAYLALQGNSNDNGSYVCKLIDSAGNESTSSELVVNAWDTTAPDINVTLNPDASTPSSMKLVTVEVLDDNPHDTPIAFTEKGDINSLTEDDFSFVNSYVISDNGTYYIYARDVAGNISQYVNPATGETSLVIENVDHTAPTIDEVQLDQSLDENGQPKVVDNNPCIKITVVAHDDDPSSGQAGTVWYKLEKDGAVIRDWDTNPVFDLITESGNYIIHVKDAAGNEYSYPLNNVDVRAIYGLYDSAELQTVFGVTFAAAPMSWTRGDVTISALGGYPEKLNPTAPFSYDGGNTWTADRSYVVSSNRDVAIAIKDNYGNIFNYCTIPIQNIDKAAPEFTTTTSAKNNAIVINASDVISGLDEIYYQYNNGDKKALMTFVENVHESGAVSLVIDKQGTYTIYVVDKAGNESSKSVEINGMLVDNDLFDGTPEEVAAKISAHITATPTSWTNNSVTLSFTPDSTNGFANNPYSWDGGINWINSQNYTAMTNGNYVLHVKDVYGNIYTSNAVAVGNIDKVAPVISAEQNGNYMSITATDTQSGISRIAWQGGTATSVTTLKTYSEGMGSAALNAALSSNGVYYIYVYDNAGNVNQISKSVSGVKTSTDNGGSSGGSSGKTVEKYYYYNTTEKSVPVYQNSGSTTQPTYTQPVAITTPIPATTTTTTKTTTPSSTKSTADKTTTSKTSTATVTPSATSKKLTSEVIAATPVTSAKAEEDVQVVSDENLAKYRNSRVNGAVTATMDSKNKSGFNPVFGILAALMTISLIAGGIYWYVAKYKPRLAESEIGEGDGFDFAEDIALEQKEES